MKRFALGLLACLMLVGCGDPNTEETTSGYQLPQELVDKGCKIYRMEGKSRYQTIRVVYCPNAQTTSTYMAGKTRQSAALIAE